MAACAPDAAAEHAPDSAPTDAPEEAGSPVAATGEASSPPVESAAHPAPPVGPADVAQALRQAFPALFGGAAKPLKLRIQVDIQARAPGRFGKQALSAFFRRHTGSTSYLIAITKAPHRFDLDGQPAGDITTEHRQVALAELARRRDSQQSRRDLEEQQRRNRAGLLHDFQTTTLTKANFCALKGVPLEELDGLLEIARTEAAERARQAPVRDAGTDRRGPGARPAQGRRPGNDAERRGARSPGGHAPSRGRR